MSASETALVLAEQRPRQARLLPLALAFGVVGAVLHLVPWWTLVRAGTDWPDSVRVLGTLAFTGTAIAIPVLLALGLLGKRLDWATSLGNTLLGGVWVLFSWALIGNGLRLALSAAGVADPHRSRVVALSVMASVVVLLPWGYLEAVRVPRVVRTEVTLPALDPGLDGTRIVLLTDTHFGPVDRTLWSEKVAETVNSLEPDIVCLTGDIADGTVHERREQAAPLESVRARLARVYVTGNHEYGNHAQGWIDHMRVLGWTPLHNQHLVVGDANSRLVLAGIDDTDAATAGCPGHGADIGAALVGKDNSLPTILLAHQPKSIDTATEHGVDLQLSGHTHGGQIWPFHHLVRLDQPVLRGLTRHGDRTQMYTSRGTGYWGPPLRIFAPSEISLLILRSGKIV